MKLRRHLYVSDLDGTLLDERGGLSDRTKKGLVALLKQDVDFTVASARSYSSIKSIFGDFPFRLPIIEFNGGFITDYATGEHIETNALESSLATEVFDQVVKSGQRPFVSTFNGREDCLYYDELINTAMLWYENRRRRAKDRRLRRTRDLRATMQEQVVSMTVMAQSEASISALKNDLEARYGERLKLYSYENAYSLGSWWLTIHAERASKHIALLTLRDRFLPGARITAMGDNFNDLDMLRVADHAIAVENAVPALQQIAHRVVGHHRTDSVVRFMEDEVRKRSALDFFVPPEAPCPIIP